MKRGRRRKWSKNKVIIGIKQLHKELGRRPTKHDNSGLYIASRKFFSTWNKAMQKAGYEVKFLQKPKIPKKLTPELAYFIGLLVTDGHLVDNKKNYCLIISTSYEEELKLVIELINKLFSYNPTIRGRKYGFNKRINYEIRINSKDLVYFFKKEFNIPSGPKSKIVRIPKIMFNTNNSNLIGFIRGIMDGDGNISLNKPVNITSGSYHFLKDLEKLFLKLNLKTGRINWDKTAYRIYLYYKDNLKIYNLFYNSARRYYPRKKEILEINTFKNKNLFSLQSLRSSNSFYRRGEVVERSAVEENSLFD